MTFISWREVREVQNRIVVFRRQGRNFVTYALCVARVEVESGIFNLRGSEITNIVEDLKTKETSKL